MDIIFCRADDWEGLFVDNVLYTEGHHIRVEDVLEMLVESGKSVASYECKRVNPDWLDYEACFPMSLKNVVFVD